MFCETYSNEISGASQQAQGSVASWFNIWRQHWFELFEVVAEIGTTILLQFIVCGSVNRLDIIVCLLIVKWK